MRQLHLYGFKKMNSRKNSANSGRKKELIFHHDDFLRGREDLIACMQTVKKDTKDKMKKKKEYDECALEDVESSSKLIDAEESGIEMKVDRLDSKMDGMHLKLDELTRQIQTSLTVLLAASSNIPDYQPIPLKEKHEFHHTAKRKRWDDEEAKMPSRIQLQSVNIGSSQLTLDTDEMNVIQTLMDCDDDDDDDDKKVDNFDTTVENHQAAQEPKVQVHTLVDAEVVEEAVDHVYIAETKESRKRWYTKKKYIIGITVIIILIIFTGVLVGQLIKTGNDSNESVQNPPRNDPKPPRAPDDTKPPRAPDDPKQ